MLDVNTIYSKTDAGVAEVQHRSLGLRAELRRLLILIDGNTPLSRLAAFVRGIELESLIFELETQGLITSPSVNECRKTEAGVSELKHRSLNLRPELRRLLILVDGRTPLSRLAGFFPGFDIEVLVAELVSMGLAIPPVAGNHATGAGLVATPAMSDNGTMPVRRRISHDQLLAVHNAAIRELHDILGPKAAELAERIHKTTDSVELRAVIADIQEALNLQYGFSTGERFVQAVRGSSERQPPAPATQV